MCLKLGQGVHSHLAQSTVEQPLGFLLLFLATPRQGSWGWSPPFTLGYTLTSLRNAGRGWGARLFLWGSWGWPQSILHGNCCWGRNMGITLDSSWRRLFMWKSPPTPDFLEGKRPGVPTLLQHACSHVLVQSQMWSSCRRLGVKLQCLAHSPLAANGQGVQPHQPTFRVKPAASPARGRGMEQGYSPQWPASWSGLPARTAPSRSLAQPPGSTRKSPRKGQRQGEERSGERNTGMAKGKQKQQNRRGKKQGCRLLYNSWLD